MADIHNYKDRTAKNIARIKDSPEILPRNKEIILDFINHLSTENLSEARINRCVCDLIRFDRMLKKPFDKVTKDDLKNNIADLNRTNLSEETKKGHKIILRKLYRFLCGVEEKGKYPDIVNWISIAIPRTASKLPEELLTEEELKLIIQNCTNSRDRAFFATLGESGCRVGEIGNMHIKHISFEEHGARLTVKGKTGMRKILVVASVPYLQEWLNIHPKGDNPEAPLWHNKRGNSKILTYTRIAAILKSAARRAGIKKRVHLHLFRHSRATQLANTLSDSQLKHYLGWAQSSKMASIYIHMSGKDTDGAILKANGMEVKLDKKESKLKPPKCARCQTVNQITNKFCKLCGFILNEEKASELIKKESERQDMDNLLTDLIKDKEVLQFLITKAKEKGVTN